MSFKVTIGRFSNIPVSFKYPLLSSDQNWQLIESFIPFKKWIGKWDEQAQLLEETVMFHGIEIEDFNLFGSRIGFLKFRLDARYKEDGVRLPGIVFMRGDAVAILLVLHSPGNDDPYVVMVQQPRIPFASLGFLELPGTLIPLFKQILTIL